MPPESHYSPQLERTALTLTRSIIDVLRDHRQAFPDLGAIVLLADMGPGGALAYQSTIVREDAIRTLIEFVRHQLSLEVLGPDKFDRALYHQANVLYQISRRPGDKDYRGDRI